MSLMFAFLFSSVLLGESIFSSSLQDPDLNQNIMEAISSKGYPVEEHTVQTADGYILNVYRIPHGRSELKKTSKKYPVILQHGVFSSAHDFVADFPNQSMGYVLADSGYDVWLANSRGNAYGKRHIKYTPEMWKFWDYSFDDMAKYDLPATIDYVLKISHDSQLAYIGHSQGAASAFALLSESQEYNKKIALFFALGPVAYLGNTRSPGSIFAPLAPLVHETLYLGSGIQELCSKEDFQAARFFCRVKPLICAEAVFTILGRDPVQLNQTRIPIYVSHIPDGSSLKSLIHIAQLVNSKRFQKYDYYSDNYRFYQQSSPPEYDITRISAPVVLMWGQNDLAISYTDIQLLENNLKNLVKSYKVPFPAFNHPDFLLAIDAKVLFHDEILRLLMSHLN